MDKRVSSLADAVTGIHDCATILISGFGEAGSPTELVHALVDLGPRDLTVVSNNAGNGHVGLAALIEAGQVRRLICSFPRSTDAGVFTAAYRSGSIELEVVPQGTLAERLRAAGAGIPAFFTPTSVGTPLAQGKEVREFNGRKYVMEHALPGDFALVKADRADRFGNLSYNKVARNFGPLMCMAAHTTIVQVRASVHAGDIDPERVVTPGIFVERVVEVPSPVHESDLIASGARYP
ncbi:MAG: 3-oxoacid CoA-transferase subunit A [Gammaproteobacteria bacterium]